MWIYSLVQYGVYLVIVAALITFLVIDTKDERYRLVSFFGLLVFVLLGWIFSKHPSKVSLMTCTSFIRSLLLIWTLSICLQVKWSHVTWGVGLQFIFGLIVLRWELGRQVIQCLGDKITIFLDYSNEGSGFVYGYLVTDKNMAGIVLGSVFAFKVKLHRKLLCHSKC